MQSIDEPQVQAVVIDEESETMAEMECVDAKNMSRRLAASFDFLLSA